MPELPEMENYKILLNHKIVGQVITKVDINREKSINVPSEEFIKSVKGQKVVHVKRRAKHLLFDLENGYVLLLHLMLGGWMYYGTDVEKPKRTIQIQLNFGKKSLYFIGLRLGFLHIFNKDQVKQALTNLGPEPLEKDFTLEFFLKYIENKRGRLKTKLLDQKFLSGIGNRYSDEICFHAGILPTRDLNQLEQSKAIQLYHSIQSVLREGIENGGYMENPFYKEDSKTGGYENMCKVYGREGETCYRCGSKIIKEILSSRKTFYCSGCQK